MALSNERFEFHLTPKGWVEGDEKLDFGKEKKVPVPADRVMTICCRDRQSCLHAKAQLSRSVVWRSSDEASVKTLVKRFGACPKGFEHWPEVK
jgi:hypothetical protein